MQVESHVVVKDFRLYLRCHMVILYTQLGTLCTRKEEPTFEPKSTEQRLVCSEGIVMNRHEWKGPVQGWYFRWLLFQRTSYVGRLRELALRRQLSEY